MGTRIRRGRADDVEFLAWVMYAASRAHLQRAIELDPKCPLPYLNMGKLALDAGSAIEAMPWFQQARDLGYRGDWTDRAVRASQQRNAALWTTGDATAGEPLPQPVRPSHALSFAGSHLVQVANDAVTPFEVVVASFEQVLGLSGREAIQVALSVHHLGRAPCAGFDDETHARQKADELAAFARERGYSLACEVVQRT